jgi:hypothetical protein
MIFWVSDSQVFWFIINVKVIKLYKNRTFKCLLLECCNVHFTTTVIYLYCTWACILDGLYIRNGMNGSNLMGSETEGIQPDNSR